uniref:Uncharacterized protein n=1 Tax=Romanomermis culicivorax TaxID=13658 RepID=A0A915HNG6_ROMCU
MIFKVYDQFTFIWSRKILNSKICAILSIVQLFFAAAAFAQHIFSLLTFHGQIFACKFVHSPQRQKWATTTTMTTQPPNTFSSTFMSFDIIIFDFGLFEKLWGIQECIANHIDGGYLRFVWCISQILVIILFLLTICCLEKPRPILLTPILSFQSFYSIGLLILTLSGVPKFLPMLFGNIDKESLMPMLIYFAGASLNFFCTYVLWHYYWYLSDLHKPPRAPTTACSTVYRKYMTSNRKDSSIAGTPLTTNRINSVIDLVIKKKNSFATTNNNINNRISRV